ncbi:hypothetical protein DSO57_1034318 [Entomophthora muscae]|uniref:Uncharacterized protein n=1 Tax=Entomophthora muscae TaxID=34485 RepID=A0ACC2TB80_9FUNG|nr:hypothetical protein DSO57_1034318 [Entomophthora muscae]
MYSRSENMSSRTSCNLWESHGVDNALETALEDDFPQDYLDEIMPVPQTSQPSASCDTSPLSSVLDWTDHPATLNIFHVLDIFSEATGKQGIKLRLLGSKARLTFESKETAQTALSIFNAKNLPGIMEYYQDTESDPKGLTASRDSIFKPQAPPSPKLVQDTSLDPFGSQKVNDYSYTNESIELSAQDPVSHAEIKNCVKITNYPINHSLANFFKFIDSSNPKIFSSWAFVTPTVLYIKTESPNQALLLKELYNQKNISGRLTITAHPKGLDFICSSSTMLSRFFYPTCK